MSPCSIGEIAHDPLARAPRQVCQTRIAFALRLTMSPSPRPGATMNNLTAQCNPGCSGMRHPADSVKLAHRTAANPGPSSSLAIGEVLPEAARRFGDKVALIVGAEAFSFSELDAMSNGVANGLVAVGVEPGDRVTLYGPNCWEWLVAYYAIAKSGAVVNPISSMFTVDEVRYVVADSGARVVVAASEKGIPVLDLVGTGGLSSVVLWGDDVPEGA